MSSVNDCKIIELPKVSEYRGNLTFIEENRHVPFDIKRVFYVYDIPSGQSRGAHAHRTLHELIICLSGSVEVQMDDGVEKRSIRLNRPWLGLHVPPMVWASEGDFNPGTVYVVLCSHLYDADDYIRDYDRYVAENRG